VFLDDCGNVVRQTRVYSDEIDNFDGAWAEGHWKEGWCDLNGILERLIFLVVCEDLPIAELETRAVEYSRPLSYFSSIPSSFELKRTRLRE
jgi:hypothetical protein